MKAIGELTPNELNTVRAAVEHLTDGTSHQRVVEDRADDELQLFYVQLIKALKTKGISSPPWFVIRQRSAYASFRKKFKVVESYTKKYFGQLSKPKRMRLYHLYATLAADSTEDNPDVPLDAALIMRNVDKIPGYVTQAFPAYAESGYLPLILSIEQ